ncbi:MAG: preprotein translocase subunit SecG [Alphaproteobacteria bacterium]|nr:MAG: preprotein translocase subunit SecG [Alphaproteobacteria bacterium]
MQTVLLVIHILLALVLIGVILVQRSEGGGLGIGGGTMGGLMTARGSANFLTRVTAIVAGLFMLTSVLLAILAGQTRHESRNVADKLILPVSQAPVPTANPAVKIETPPETPAPTPAQPIAPDVPLSR